MSKLKQKIILLTIVLIVVILASLFIALNWKNSSTVSNCYVGVEVAYTNTNTSDIRTMVGRVKDYTNVFVIGSVELTYNETALNESCDYIYDAGLKIIVLLTNHSNYNYDELAWVSKAQQKYGSGFLALYRYDEPGGDQLDNRRLAFVNNASTYADAASNYTYILEQHVNFYRGNASTIITADYGLYWWDYKGGYDAILAEFVGNQSRQRHIALCRGAALTNNKNWGAIITWKYNQEPYVESDTELYNDLTLAYTNGAKYIIVFDYPKTGPYGILNDNHFNALKRFWDYARMNPQDFDSIKAEAAYILPKDYGSGLRSSTDTIWGLFLSDNLSAKSWNDIIILINHYNSKFNILFDDISLGNVTNRYSKVFYWNETVT
ncbi:MAG TPA: hypothetical protein VK209_07500 [Candidatus Sulfotelmatobacter sp.]|nr:hypothetical protein [Candidatus Sulfotelmatobacter sp.]